MKAFRAASSSARLTDENGEEEEEEEEEKQEEEEEEEKEEEQEEQEQEQEQTQEQEEVVDTWSHEEPVRAVEVTRVERGRRRCSSLTHVAQLFDEVIATAAPTPRDSTLTTVLLETEQVFLSLRHHHHHHHHHIYIPFKRPFSVQKIRATESRTQQVPSRERELPTFGKVTSGWMNE